MRYLPVATIALLALFIPSQAQADKFQVSDTVYEYFKSFRGDVEETRSGTFAVSVDGLHFFYAYCKGPPGCSSERDALEGCRGLYHMACKVFATDRETAFDFEVVAQSRHLGSTDPIRSRILGDDDLYRGIVGNTMMGHYINQVRWSEYFSPDGKLYGNHEILGDYRAAYEIKGGKLCFDYEGSFEDWCAWISRDGDSLEFVNESGNLQTGIIGTQLVRGRPRQ